jgi:hypothetical protein
VHLEEVDGVDEVAIADAPVKEATDV